jgi:hypothetical protein
MGSGDMLAYESDAISNYGKVCNQLGAALERIETLEAENVLLRADVVRLQVQSPNAFKSVDWRGGTVAEIRRTA